MEKNIGETDRMIRMGAGAALLVAGLLKGSLFFIIIGIVLLGTAYLKHCPAYKLIGMNTKK